MRKRKKTATPGCTTPGKSTHTSCRGGTVQSGHQTPSSTSNPKPSHGTHSPPSSLLPPWAVSALEGPLSLPSGLVAMPQIPSRRGNISDLEPAVLHAQIRGWLRQSPRGGRMFLTTKGTPGSLVAATCISAPVLLPGPPQNPRDPQVSRERPSSPWPSTHPQAREQLCHDLHSGHPPSPTATSQGLTPSETPSQNTQHIPRHHLL